ncbi:MAG TPA: glycoside hydrolase family 30 beta sandwich domain-containing protein, partial [Puia sp.]|nr:glycoside hydrolase family 30 beta sandwich domain-containing protein [Puia sp.]
FGFALTGGSAQHIIRMDAQERKKLLQEIFGKGSSDISVSYLRISIGASDLNERVFTYDDMPDGQSDPGLKHFDLQDDKKDVIPVLKEILAINPSIKILGSPWSAPAWMKTNRQMKGGSLEKKYYGVYAEYFVKYIQAMQREGIRIDAITVQNEPLNEGNTPSMKMLATEQLQFIKEDLGPLFRKAGIKTKIILYDHNCDEPGYPLTILKDPAAAVYVDGSGFHLYEGKIEALSQVHNEYPDKNLYFTEQMVVDSRGFRIAAQVDRLIIGATRNWSRNVLLWNLAADKDNKPHTDNGGCSMCQGALTIEGNTVSRNLAYYVIAHASKFVPPGSVRIESTLAGHVTDVAFRTPRGKTVLIVANNSGTDRSFSVQTSGRSFSTTLDAGSVGTYVW